MKGRWTYLYRAVDKQGRTADFLLTPKRDVAAAKRFFQTAMTGNGTPRIITLDAYAASHRSVRELKAAGHAGGLSAGLRSDGWNTSDRSTLRGFLDRIESAYGKARRVWLMEPRHSDRSASGGNERPGAADVLSCGHAERSLNQHEKKWLDLPWQQVRESVQVKLYEHEGELYVLARSEGRQAKENAIRRKKIARLLRKLRAMRRSLPKRDQLLSV